MYIKGLYLIFLIFTIVSCGSLRTSSSPPNNSPIQSTKDNNPTTSPKQNDRNDYEEFIETKISYLSYDERVDIYVTKFSDIAKKEMEAHKIPASITMAQGILESGAGKGTLALKSNNHFGIKCHKGWTGKTVKHDDDAAKECFRHYNDPAESYQDHSKFLTLRSRYASLFDMDIDDYESWALGLKKAGYATDPKYPDKLISLIERYQLYELDKQVLGKRYKNKKVDNLPTVIRSPKMDIRNIDPKKLYIIKKGDTLYSIAIKYQLSVEELKEINKLVDNNISIGQRLIISK